MANCQGDFYKDKKLATKENILFLLVLINLFVFGILVTNTTKEILDKLGLKLGKNSRTDYLW